MRDTEPVGLQVTWTLQPSVLVGVAVLATLYAAGWRRARRPGEPHPPGPGRLALFAGGLVAVLAALVSPLDGFSDQLMVMHMVQHVLLLDLAPILLILGLTKGVLRPVTRRVHALERRVGPLAHPAFAVLLYAGLMWLWHVPHMYDLALRHEGIHALEHVCFSVAGSLYWWHLLSPIRSRWRLGGLGPVLYMVVTKLLVGLLGIMLAFAPNAIYPFYEHHQHFWNLSAQQDQSLAGVVMALEQSLVMGVALVYLFVRMLAESEREAEREERYGIA
jgi:cytochrome c oxidase assembly factor CtaG